MLVKYNKLIIFDLNTPHMHNNIRLIAKESKEAACVVTDCGLTLFFYTII